MGELDSDADLAPQVITPEIDDEPGEDDHGGGNVEDEGEPENGLVHPAYGIDQSSGPLGIHPR